VVKALEATDASAESSQFGHSGLGPAAAVEQAVRLIDNLPQRPKVRPTSSDSPQGSLLGGSQVTLRAKVYDKRHFWSGRHPSASCSQR